MTAPKTGGGAATPDGTPPSITVTAPPPTTPDVLRAAARILHARGLCQGTTFARNGRVGLDGALWLGAGAAEPGPDFAAWIEALPTDVTARYAATADAVSERCDGVLVQQIGDWLMRTTDEAVALLEATADDLDKETRR